MALETLYKYGKIGEHSETLFSTATIWFSSPGSLNDPFECRPWFTFDGSEQQFLDLFTTIARRKFPNCKPPQLVREARKLYNQGRHKDPKFWEKFRIDVTRMLSKQIGVCCLTRSSSNILMWSHYADEHKGFCLEFEATDFTPMFGAAQEVKYAEGFPTVDFFNTPHDAQVDLIFLTKYSGWQYEEEYRIIDHTSGSGLHSYRAELLKSVTFGLRMPDSEKTRIRKWIEKREVEVKLYQASIDDRDFKITLADAK